MKNPDIEKLEKLIKESGILLRKDNAGGNEETYNINIRLPRKIEPTQFLRMLADALAEKRSDISEIITDYLRGEEMDIEKRLECRYIEARIPGTVVKGTDIHICYDTLTTIIEYRQPGDHWEQCSDHMYKED